MRIMRAHLGFLAPNVGGLGQSLVGTSRRVAGVSLRASSARRVWTQKRIARNWIPVRMTASAPVAVEESKAKPEVKYLKDYKPPQYLINTVDLTFDLGDPETVVTSRLNISKNPRAVGAGNSIDLDGDKGLTLIPESLKVDGVVLSNSQFTMTDSSLTIDGSALDGKEESIDLEYSVKILPAENKALEGLYKSGGNFCTQCEAEGFRRITLYPDRPDVMSIFTTKIIADRKSYPVLLSNGNKVEEGELDGGRHYVVYHDPHRKPSYLFALVAGQLVCTEDTFTTMSGRKVDLKIFVREGDEAKTHYAMDSLKSSMKWDEEVYGREYDLEIFNVVAVDDFNMGAMENKSLNIFNSRFVLVSPDTATDLDYNNVEGIIAHEYFHNWTGNRVTCRDWFQLSLKEGLTVFRDQSFSADMNSSGVERINNVVRLRLAQFPEDAGPMAHPIRPESFIEINNFYTQTVYQKGAEVIRMLHTILGPEGFRKGTDLYFERHDGQAVTCEDWVQALQDANPEEDLTLFQNWYGQAGTPVVLCSREYDTASSTMKVTLSQTTLPTPGQDEKKMLHLPISVGLLDPSGKSIPVNTGDGDPQTTKVLNVKEKEATFTLQDVPEGSVLSVLRSFSAPVKLEIEGGQSKEELAFLMANEDDDFARWEASQKLTLITVLEYLEHGESDFPPLDSTLKEAFKSVLEDETSDPSLLATLLTVPTIGYIADQMKENDPLAIHAARNHLRKSLALELKSEFEKALERTEEVGEYSIDAQSKARRSLHGIVLEYLGTLQEPALMKKCLQTVRDAPNMTNVLQALRVLSGYKGEESDLALSEFYEKWKHNNLVVLKWFGVQAGAPREDALEIVKGLMEHEAFELTVPNKVYAVLGGFAGNQVGLHSSGQASYDFMAEQVLKLDKMNPQVASRMAKTLSRWRQYTPDRQAAMKAALEKIAAQQDLSGDVYEVVTKSLA